MLSAGHFKHAAGGRFQAEGRVSAPGRTEQFNRVRFRESPLSKPATRAIQACSRGLRAERRKAVDRHEFGESARLPRTVEGLLKPKCSRSD